MKISKAADVTEDDEITLPHRKCGWFPYGRYGLKGGGGAPSEQSTGNQRSLRLINNRSLATRNICFTNSVVQLFRKTGYASLLQTQFPQFVAGKPDKNYQGCAALYSLYTEQTRERSAASLRKLVAQKSGKEFLADGSQQDCEEFLRAVITMMSIELHGWQAFNIMHNQHVGKEKIIRKFLDNASGVCSKCGEFPSCSEQDFLCLKINIPCSSLPVDISSLIENYFSCT